MSAAFLVVDKPAGITSHDVVATLRAVTGEKKVGHTGTLDPFATGVLPLALGKATRLIQYLDEDLKVYDATIALGQRTDTGDPTGQVVGEAAVPDLEPQGLRAVLAGFVGVRMQEPPRYSAVKVDGRPLYAYARAGKDVRAKARPVRIDAVDLVELEPPLLRVRITCGRGTYARVLADEIAVALGTVGHLSNLRRERSGPFDLGRALDLPTLAELVARPTDDGSVRPWAQVLRPARGAERVPWRPRAEVRAGLAPWLVAPVDALAHLPVQQLSTGQGQVLGRSGQAPPAPRGLEPDTIYRAVADGQLVALLRLAPDGPRVERMVRPR